VIKYSCTTGVASFKDAAFYVTIGDAVPGEKERRKGEK